MRTYWVVQEVKGESYFHGPYKSKKARDNRFKRVVGGELFKFNSRFEDMERVRQEYNDARVKEILRS